MRGRDRTILKWLLRVGVSFWVVTMFYFSPGVNGYERAHFPELVHGRAWRPFVTRTLFPVTVRVASRAIPASFDAWVQDQPLGARLIASRTVRDRLGFRPPYLREYLTAFLLSVVCLVLLSLTLEKLWTALMRPAAPHASAFGVLAVLALPTMFIYYSYIYDFPTLLLYTACLLMMVRRRWGPYFALFAVGCLSKETMLLLIAVFAIYFRRSFETERATYLRFILIQVLILAVVRGGLAFVYRANPGGIAEFHLLRHNFRLMTHHWSPESFVAWGVVAILVLRNLTRRPYFARVAAAMLLPLVGLTLFLGYLDELRDYYEAYPALALLIGCSVSEWLGRPVESAAPTDASGVGPIRERPAPAG